MSLNSFLLAFTTTADWLGFSSISFFFFLKIFLMWIIFKVFIEFVTILLLLDVLGFWPRGVWDLSLPDKGLNPHPLRWKAKS